MLDQKEGQNSIALTARCRAYARLIDADAPWPTEGTVSPAELTRWLQRNKYPLLSLAPRAPAWLAAAPEFQGGVAAEQSAYDLAHREYLAVRQAWLDRGIPCLMIKSAGSYPSFPHTSDNFDILVRPEQGRAARATLREMGYVELRNIEEPRKFLFRKFHDGKCTLAVHVHEHVGWMVGFLEDGELWGRLRPAPDDPSVNVPSPEDAFMINLAHAFYENKLLRVNDIARARHALTTAGESFDWAYVKRVAATRGWLDGLAYIVLLYAAIEKSLFGATQVPSAEIAALEATLRPIGFAWRRLRRIIQGLPIDLPLDLSFVFCKTFYYRKVLADSRRTVGQRWLDVGTTLLDGIQIKSGIRPQPGMIVALSGPDGTGKTTHAQALVDALRLSAVDTSYLWSRGGSSGLPGLISRVRRRWSGKEPGPTTELSPDHLVRRRAQLANPLARLAWAWLVAADQVGTYTLRAWLPARLGKVVVCDRYVYDAAVEVAASLPAGAFWSHLAIGAMLRLTPRPGMGYIFQVSPEAIAARRPDEPLPADLEAQQGRYLTIAKEQGLRILSNEQGFAESNDRLIREVITHYMAGYETLLNALFIANPSQRNPPDPIWLAEVAR